MTKKIKPLKADEVFSNGPFSLERYGRTIRLETNWEDEEFDRVQGHLVENFPIVIEEIDKLVSKIRYWIEMLPPKRLLHLAWWQMMLTHSQIETETEIGEDEVIALRMIDYVQSVIAAVPPAVNQRDDVTDKEWEELSQDVKQLFAKIADYERCRIAIRRANEPDLDMDFEIFRSRSQHYWCLVRGKRYQVHQLEYMKDMFLPHSEVLHELFGISGEDFVAEINRILRVSSFGVGDLFNDLRRFKQHTLDGIGKKTGQLCTDSDSNPSELMNEVLCESAWEDHIEDLSGRLWGLDLFDIQKTTCLPERLLEELSWSPGQERDFFSDGQFRGWPLRIWPIFKRPFVRLDGHYYCFDQFSLFDNIYRVMQRTILRLKPEYRESWNKIQQSQSEGLPFKYLERLLPGATVMRQVFYRGKTRSGQTEWCETDGLLFYDDHLFIIEARGGAFTYTPPSTDFPAYVESLKNLILKPAMQGRRFLDYVNRSESVELFDSRHNATGRLYRSDFRRITVCAVTLDLFTELAAQVQQLRKIGVDVGSEPIWAVSIDDLRIFADVFENPLLFLHFVEQRIRAFSSDIIQCDDELDHLGLYLEHNHYCSYAKEIQKDSYDHVQFFGFRSEIDRFFYSRFIDPNTPCPPKQETPPRYFEIIEKLGASKRSARAEVAAFLLDLEGSTRSAVHENICIELRRQRTAKRPLPFSTHGDVKLTLFCWTDDSGPRDEALSLGHVQTIVVVNKDSRRLLLELNYSSEGNLEEVNWEWVEFNRIPSAKLPKLNREAEILRRKRISRLTTESGVVGRNDSCPCGSGNKYKNCCLVR